MLRRTRRMAALLTAAMLLLPTSLGKAAAANPPVPSPLPAAFNRTAPDTQAYSPASLADPVMAALGGPAGVEARRQALLAAQGAAAATTPSAGTQPNNPSTQPEQTVTINPTGAGLTSRPAPTVTATAVPRAPKAPPPPIP